MAPLEGFRPSNTPACAIRAPSVISPPPGLSLCPSTATTTQPQPAATTSPEHDSSPDQAANPAPQVLANPTNVGNAGKAFTTLDVQTTFTTAGVFTTDVTTTLPNGEATPIQTTTSGTRTITSQITQVGSTSSSTGPPKGIIGGVTGATVIVILCLVVFCILRLKRRKMATTSNPNYRLPHPSGSPTESNQGRISQLSITPRPFLDCSPAQSNSPVKQEATEPTAPPSQQLVRNDQDEGQDNDPFRDQVAVQADPVNEEEAQGARDALVRLQQLTTQLEAELRQLGDLAQSGQLSTEDRARLEEIRRTTGMTISFDPTHRHFSIVSGDTSYSTAPPSYHTDHTEGLESA